MADDKACACSEAPRLIFACSGASNLGRIADLAARTLTKDGVGKMYCLAGIGGRVSGIIENTKAASRIFAIDGCDQDCAKKCLELAGFKQVEQLRGWRRHAVAWHVCDVATYDLGGVHPSLLTHRHADFRRHQTARQLTGLRHPRSPRPRRPCYEHP